MGNDTENDEELARVLLSNVSSETLRAIDKELWGKANSTIDLLDKIKIQRIIVLVNLEIIRRPDY